MAVIKQEGKRFSRRTTEQRQVKNGTLFLEHIRWDDHLTARTIDRYRQQSVEILKTAGIEVEALLKESPAGSGVRDYVINSTDVGPDSLEGLAATLLEQALHLSAYKKIPGGDKPSIGVAYRFGRLAMLLDVYRIDKFEPKGRGVGPIRKRIATLLKKSPEMTNVELWDEIAKKPPKGWIARNSPRLGRYLEAPSGQEDCNYRGFQNAAAKVRKQMKG